MGTLLTTLYCTAIGALATYGAHQLAGYTAAAITALAAFIGTTAAIATCHDS